MNKLLKFAFPIMMGNLLQQLYNIVDTLIVGRYLGENALAAVGSSYTLMVFITSIIIGLCMGSSAFFSMQFGSRDQDRLEKGIFIAFMAIGVVALVLNVAVYAGVGGILVFLRVPQEVTLLMREYLGWIFAGIMAVFLYNFVANLLRAVGNSTVPLLFLGISAIANIGLDLLFIRGFGWGVGGAASATVLSQYIAGIGIVWYYLTKYPQLRVTRRNRHFDMQILKELAELSSLTCLQQSIMNFGILMVCFAGRLMGMFLKEESGEAIAIGAGYLRIEGAFYFGIGLLFLFYGYFRAIHQPGISVVLTTVSLGTRVILAYALSGLAWIGVTGIWMSVPIGWILADLAGMWYYWKCREALCDSPVTGSR